MRKEYNLKLIKDYVEGNDLEDYNIDELENDYEFMISVIKYTNDKNIYNLCSDEVKNNYEFVKFIINYFKNDIEFIDKISEQYLLKLSGRFLDHRTVKFGSGAGPRLINECKTLYEFFVTKVLPSTPIPPMLSVTQTGSPLNNSLYSGALKKRTNLNFIIK